MSDLFPFLSNNEYTISFSMDQHELLSFSNTFSLDEIQSPFFYVESHSSEIINSYEIIEINKESYSNDKITNSHLSGKKRGRKKKSFSKNRPEHNKFSKDNIKRKIQVHYLKFLRNLINQVIDELWQKEKNIINLHFYRLNYKFAIKNNKRFI